MDDKGDAEKAEGEEEPEEEHDEDVDLVENLAYEDGLPESIIYRQKQKMYKPCEIICTVLEAHDFHALARFCFFFAYHTLDDVYEDE